MDTTTGRDVVEGPNIRLDPVTDMKSMGFTEVAVPSVVKKFTAAGLPRLPSIIRTTKVTEPSVSLTE